MGDLSDKFDKKNSDGVKAYNLVTVTVTTGDVYYSVICQDKKKHIVPASRESYYEAVQEAKDVYRINRVDIYGYKHPITGQPTVSVKKTPYDGLDFEGGLSLGIVMEVLQQLEVALIAIGDKFVHHDADYFEHNRYFRDTELEPEEEQKLDKKLKLKLK